MTRIKHIKTATGLVLGAMLALGTLAGPASARWYNDERGWQEDRRWENNERYNGYYYREPPVVYSTPYRGNYGYYPPPVYYDNTPGFSIRIR